MGFFVKSILVKMHKGRIFNRRKIPAALHFPMNKVSADGGGGDNFPEEKAEFSRRTVLRERDAVLRFSRKKVNISPAINWNIFPSSGGKNFCAPLSPIPGSGPFFPLLSHKM